MTMTLTLGATVTETDPTPTVHVVDDGVRIAFFVLPDESIGQLFRVDKAHKSVRWHPNYSRSACGRDVSDLFIRGLAVEAIRNPIRSLKLVKPISESRFARQRQ